MSANNTLNVLEQSLIAQLPETFVGRYSTLSAAALILYDYILTFPLEQRHIWQGKINVMKILFIFNRYISLIYLYGEILLDFVKPATFAECQAFYYILEISELFCAFAVTTIFILRTYAIYGRSRTVLFILAIPGIGLVASSIWEAVTQTTVALPPQLQIGPWTCWFNDSSSAYTAELVNFVSAVVFDVLVVILSVCRTGRLAMQSRKVKINKALSFILLCDGMLYYSAIFVPQFVTVVLNVIVLRTGDFNLNDASSAISIVIDALQIVMVNRLILNLIHAANTEEDSEFRTRTGPDLPSFVMGPFLGSIGGSFRTRPDDFDDEYWGDDGMVDGEKAEGNTAESTSAYETGDPKGNVILNVNAEIEEISV